LTSRYFSGRASVTDPAGGLDELLDEPLEAEGHPHEEVEEPEGEVAAEALSEGDVGVVAAAVVFALAGVVVPLAGGVGEVAAVVVEVVERAVCVVVGFVVAPAAEVVDFVAVTPGVEEAAVFVLVGVVAVPEVGALAMAVGAVDAVDKGPAEVTEGVVVASVEAVDVALEEAASVAASLMINTPSRVVQVNP
jgi:hypothetical protein